MENETGNKGTARWGLLFGFGMLILFVGFFTDIGAVLGAGVLILLGVFGAAVFVH